VRSPPDLDSDLVIDAMSSRWGVDVRRLDYLPLGAGSHHWSADGDLRCFVTVDDLQLKVGSDFGDLGPVGEVLRGALGTAAALRAVGHGYVVAPVPCQDGDVMHVIDGRYALAVYPWISGDSYEWGDDLDRSWMSAIVDRLAELHSASTDQFAGTAVEDFELTGTRLIVPSSVEDWPDAGPLSRPGCQLLVLHREATLNRLAQFEELSASLRSDRMVVTHGEPHPGNTMLTTDGLVLIDWDTVKIAPPERDMWSIVDRDPTAEAAYLRCGGVELSRDVMDFYRLRWDLDDLCAYAHELAQPHATTPDSEHALSQIERYLTDE